MAFAPPLLAPPAPEVQDATDVAAAIDPQALGASQVLPPEPPPEASQGLPLDALMAASSAPPPAFPQNDVDAALAPTVPPQGGPALSLLPPPEPIPGAPIPGAPATPAEAAKANVAATEAVGKEQVANATEKAQLDAAAREEEAKAAAEKAQRLQVLQDRQETHRQAAAHEVAAARAKAETEPFHTFWENRSIGQNIATGIGLILGGVSWNANHVNRGVDMLNKAMELDLQLQKEKHADLWRAVNEAQEGQRTLDAEQLHELSAFSANEGAKHDALASRLMSAAAMNKGKGDVTAAKALAVKESAQAAKDWQNAEYAAATANHLKELDAAKKLEDAERERYDKERNRIAEIRANKYKTKGGGGGGGGAREQGAIALKEKIAELQKSGLKGIDLDVAIDKAATKLKIPLAGKPNTLNVRSIRADMAKETNQFNIDQKHADADATRVVRDPDTGVPYAMAGTAKIADARTKQDVQLGDAARRLQELADDIAKNGKKIDPTDTEATARRIRKFANAVIAIGIVSPLGKTNESLHLETESIGIPGTVDWSHLGAGEMAKYALGYGASASGILDKVREIKHNRENYRRTLTPLTPEEIKKYSGAAGAPSKVVKPPAGSKFVKLSDGRPAAKYPDGSIHLPDGSTVDVL